ncbi:DUF4350 domain-containing protein [Chryseosolibacter indicus]|uniref:DUF4350 domain-containing protein n=1 Tax=Chryseosolibacter indicus TaxID=2782351 RepID=A0ABS5VSK8_9BACT|nr:DUF4350 domain-containing protein [Chryseosolibacter indicus]MBT1704403.1 DUF4350 domain-containing protein [Chryseosolibacter indicus]
MRKDWKYILYVGGAIALFVLVKLITPKQYNWNVTLAHDDKDPYGTYALFNLLPDVLEKKRIKHNYKTIYELKDSLTSNENILIVATSFNPDKEDCNALLAHVNNGGNAFISSQYIWGSFADTLDVGTRDYLFSGETLLKEDSTSITFVNPQLDTMEQYWYRKDNIQNHFDEFDTVKTTIIARNSNGKPVTIRIPFGKGNFILNATPLAFTNIYLLAGSNSNFVSQTLSYLPIRDVNWTEYYHLGRMEATTPLRFILTNEPLRWAYYITLFAILAFMIFEAKRKQRIIPIIKPLANTTLEFVSTIGNLYFQNGNHKNIAEKKILFLLDHIRTQYMLSAREIDDEFIKTLALKSGKSEQELRVLFRTIHFIQSATEISGEQLVDLNAKIETFNRR